METDIKIASINDIVSILGDTSFLLIGVPIVDGNQLSLTEKTVIKKFDKLTTVIVDKDSNGDEENPEDQEGNEGEKESKVRYVAIGDVFYDVSLIRDSNLAMDRYQVCSSIRFHACVTNRNDNTNGDSGLSVVSEKLDSESRALLSKYHDFIEVVGVNLRGLSYRSNLDLYLNNKLYFYLKQSGVDTEVLDKVHPFVPTGDKRLDLSTYALYTVQGEDTESENFPNAFKSDPMFKNQKKRRIKNIVIDGENVGITTSKDNTRMKPLRINLGTRQAGALNVIIENIKRIQVAVAYSIACRNTNNSTYNEKDLMSYLELKIEEFTNSGFVIEERELDEAFGLEFGDIEEQAAVIRENMTTERALDVADDMK